eukprot:scaffold13191_cov178-Amphora_coffeaeformis.AAC.4
MAHKVQAFLRVLLFGAWCDLVTAQNTDGELRINFFRFILTLAPQDALQCNTAISETVRNVAEDCLQTFAPTECADLFVEVPPEQILLGGTACRDENGFLIFGGAMDFPVAGAEQGQVDQCVQQVLQGNACAQTFQTVFPGVTGLSYSVDTPQPTGSPTLTPSAVPSVPPTEAPTTAAPTTDAPTTDVPTTDPPTSGPSSEPSLPPSLRTTQAPTVSPSTEPADSSDDRGAGIADEVVPREGMDGRDDSLGVYIGAAAGGFCMLLLLFLFIVKKRRREDQVASEEVKDLELAEQPKGGLHTLDSLNPQPVMPPPGILHNTSPRTGPRAQSRLFHSLPEDDYSAPGTSIGDPDLTLISSVDMGSMDGSESFVDQNRNLSFTISKDMLGGSSEVPKNRNAVLSRLGASLAPDPLPLASSSSDDGDAPPSPPARTKDGFYELQDDEDDGTDEELMLGIPDTFQHEDFAPDTEWDPDDTDEGEDLDTKDMFRDRKSPVNVDDSEVGLQLPIPPELKDGTQRKPRSSTPRSVLGESGKLASVKSSSSGSSAGS